MELAQALEAFSRAVEADPAVSDETRAAASALAAAAAESVEDWEAMARAYGR